MNFLLILVLLPALVAPYPFTFLQCRRSGVRCLSKDEFTVCRHSQINVLELHTLQCPEGYLCQEYSREPCVQDPDFIKECDAESTVQDILDSTTSTSTTVKSQDIAQESRGSGRVATAKEDKDDNNTQSDFFEDNSIQDSNNTEEQDTNEEDNSLQDSYNTEEQDNEEDNSLQDSNNTEEEDANEEDSNSTDHSESKASDEENKK